MKRTVYIAAVLLMGIASIGIVNGQNVTVKTPEFKVNFKQGADTVRTYLPEILWLSPSDNLFQTKENKTTIKAQIHSESQIKMVMIELRTDPAKEANSSTEYKLDNNMKHDALIDQSIYLREGNNYITIAVTNVEGGTSMDTRKITSGESAIASAFTTDRKDYALFFATDKYEYWGDLVNPVDDAEAIERELKKYYSFETEVVKNASQDEVIEKIREYTLEKKFKPQDQLFIFFAGHGHFDEAFNEGYVVAKNSSLNDPSFNSYISYNRLRSIVDNIKCEHILVMLDVCFGGTFDQSLERGESPYSEQNRTEYIVSKLNYKTRKFVTSGGKQYVSDGIPGKNSPFTRNILEALRNFGGFDRVLTFNELLGYVEKVKPAPHYGNFGENEPGSDFMFIVK